MPNMPIKINVNHDTSEHKIGITRMFLKAMPTREEYEFICKMADEARQHQMDMDAFVAHYQLKAQIARKHAAEWEDQRWQMRQTMNRWNKNAI